MLNKIFTSERYFYGNEQPHLCDKKIYKNFVEQHVIDYYLYKLLIVLGFVKNHNTM